MKNLYKELLKKKKYRYIIIYSILLLSVPLIFKLFAPEHQNSERLDMDSQTTQAGGNGNFFSLQGLNKGGKAEDKASEYRINLLREVGKLVNLPAGEEPLIATVTDPNELKNQSFFADSEAGDKVIIYKKFDLAILYRPKTNKVITTAEVEFRIDKPTVFPSISATASANITASPAI